MRSILLILILLPAGCFAGTMGGGQGGSRPGVVPMLSQLPGDAAKRDAILDSSNQVAGPEHRKGMTVKERKAETIGATAAAILGSAFSKTQNVTLGGAVTFGGDSVPSHAPPQPATTKTSTPPIEGDDRAKLPWIKLK